MRVYHFLSAANAIDDLRRRHAKLSEIDKLNDPFELWCSAQGNRRIRATLHSWKRDMCQRYGILCFCKRWHNPVLWSHYAESHRGVCLGFEVEGRSLMPVTYVRKRTALPLPPTQETMKQLLFTKYRDWSYEEELRCWFRLEDRDASNGLYFYNFDQEVQLCEVIAGPLCDTPKASFDAALEGYEHPVRIIKTRVAFTTFQIIENRQGFPR
jgi:hypothetical protein